jgi:diacylglycerol diphosphate phosphatase/phosphatidate phosphatase
MSFAGLGFLALYLAGKLHLFDRRGHAAKAWLSLAPYAAATLIAISRTMDYRHHWHDVVVGALLGTVVSYFTYRQYYPSLTSELSHRPYSPRIRREDQDAGILPTHHRRKSTATDDPSQSLPPPPTDDEHAGSHGPFADTKDELEGTVMRPNPGELSEIWRDGEGELSVRRDV